MSFVLGLILIFTVLRAILIEYLFRPLALYLGVAPKSSLRFAEQGCLALYYLIFCALGLVSSMTSRVLSD